jgi:hypothetical protein
MVLQGRTPRTVFNEGDEELSLKNDLGFERIASRHCGRVLAEGDMYFQEMISRITD